MEDSTDWEVADPDAPVEREPWPLRPLFLAALGAATGFFDWTIVQGQEVTDLPTLWLALLAGLTVVAGMIGFTFERREGILSLGFSLAAGVVAAGIVFWNGAPGDWGSGDGWRFASLFLALAIAAPLFQAARDVRAVRFPYPLAYDHAWVNVVLWCACWAFVGIFFLLLVLLSELFALINLRFLRELLREEWFISTLIGLAFGAALGVFREQDGVVRLLQRVVAAVLAVLAPVLAVGLAVFLLALPFTGLAPLWESWVSTTPLLLACVVGSLILANVVIGKLPEQEFRALPFRIGAMVLAVVMLPLALLAAVATGLRIDQYGFTPERLWGLTFVVIATAFGIAYWVSLARGRMDWAAFARPANRNLALGLCGIALLLATPLVSFNMISTNDQVARLTAGKIAADKFDWHALAWEFGKPGRDALERLAKRGRPDVRSRAAEALKLERWQQPPATEEVVDIDKNIRVLPNGTPIPPAMRDLLTRRSHCRNGDNCTLVVLPGAQEALLFTDTAFPDREKAYAYPAAMQPRSLLLREGNWIEAPEERGAVTEVERARIVQGYKAGTVEVRPVQRRQVFIGGVPIGEAFE